MKKFELFLSCAAALALSGCLHFVPDYRQDLYDKLTDIQTQLSKIQAQINTTPGAKTEYAKVEQYYVAALADIQQSTDITNSLAAYNKGKLAESPSQSLAAMTSNCQKAIESDRKYYAENGQPANEGDNLKTVKDTCSIPSKVEGMMKP